MALAVSALSEKMALETGRFAAFHILIIPKYSYLLGDIIALYGIALIFISLAAAISVSFVTHEAYYLRGIRQEEYGEASAMFVSSFATASSAQGISTGYAAFVASYDRLNLSEGLQGYEIYDPASGTFVIGRR